MADALMEYKARFGECFPLMLCRDMDDGQIVAIINDCIISGKPYTVEADGDY